MMLFVGRTPEAGGARRRRRTNSAYQAATAHASRRHPAPRPVLAELDRGNEQRGGADQQRHAGDGGDDPDVAQSPISRRLRLGDPALAHDQVRRGERHARDELSRPKPT